VLLPLYLRMLVLPCSMNSVEALLVVLRVSLYANSSFPWGDETHR
jgi:hypothetical protein